MVLFGGTKKGTGTRTRTGMRFFGFVWRDENGDRDEDRDEVFAAGESAADQLVPLRRASLAFGSAYAHLV